MLLLMPSEQMVMAADPGVVSTQSVEMVFTFGSVMVGVLFYTIIIGLVASIILSLDKPGSLFVEKMQAWKVGRQGSHSCV